VRLRIRCDLDAAPVTWRQLGALAEAVAWQLVWGLRGVNREIGRWRIRATSIPDSTIRGDALSGLANKRGNIDGAALFWILAETRHVDLMRLLVTYQIMFDFLDYTSERGAGAGQANGWQLHLALADGLDWRTNVHDHYRLHPWSHDGGYLGALVRTARELCRRMPAYRAACELILHDARRAGLQAINHEPMPGRRRDALRAWVESQQGGAIELSWFEFAGAASASLSIHALLAMSAGAVIDTTALTRVYDAYFPWISVVATMLDSYVDEARDRACGHHSYIAHYQTRELAVASIASLVRRAMAATDGLPGAERHRVIVASMVALHLSHDGARSAELRPSTARLVEAGGSLTRLLVPVLRIWRITHSARAD